MAAQVKVNEVREWIVKRIFVPLHGAGVDRIQLRAGTLHDAMGLKNRLPAVCSAMRSVNDGEFEMELDAVGPIIKNGKREGAEVYCVYRRRS